MIVTDLLTTPTELLPPDVPRVLINREPLQYIQGFDVRLLGYSNTIVTELCRRLGQEWAESIGVTEPIGKTQWGVA